MPVNEKDTQVYEYPMPRGGVNIHKNIVELDPLECFMTQNCVWDYGVVKRKGQELVTTTEVVASKKILGLHRFYKSDGTKQLLAACDTLVKYFVSPSTWTTIGVTQTTNLQAYMTTWGALDKVYICNGTDAMKSWTGAAAATITIADGVPSQALPYQDRLLTIIGGNLTWSASFSDTGASWETASNCGVKPDTKLYGMAYHSSANESAGTNTKIILAGASGMYLFWGTDLRPPFTTGDYQIFQISGPGCNAPRTMVWTPIGTMWLGIDRQVYLLPFNSVVPVPIGTKIQSTIQAIEGIENIPAAQITNACAAYHDGYYILSITTSGGTYNTTQWWLDTRRLYKDDDNHYGPWYGPMKGQSISCFATQNGAGDSGELVAGEAQAKGYVYYVNKATVYGDVTVSNATTKAIQMYFKSFFHPLGNGALRKDVHVIEAELLDVLGTVNVSLEDIESTLSSGLSFGLSGNAIYWNDVYWDEQYFSSTAPTRQRIHITPPVRPRRMAVIFQHNISTDNFVLYALRVKATEQGQVFE